ncbi:MAG: response regulator [Planctomycetes bacterium]|nr:response regulator [Planctomycetota bacterium]
MSQTPSILVVDPNPAVRRMLEAHLSRQGLGVASCRTAHEAVELIEQAHFDLVISEAETPDGSGFDVLRHIQSRNSSHRIATIITSDLEQPDRILRALERGADDYLTKPISPAMAVARATAILELQSSGLLDSAGPGVLDLPRLDRTLREASGGAAKLRAICDALRDGLDAERASVYRLDEPASELVTVVAHGEQSQEGTPFIRMSAEDGLAGACLRLGHLINIPDAYQDQRFNPSFDEKTGFTTRSVLSIPLRGDDGSTIGVAQILNHRHGPFSAAEEVKALQLAPRCALTLAEAFFEVDQNSTWQQRLLRSRELPHSCQRYSQALEVSVQVFFRTITKLIQKSSSEPKSADTALPPYWEPAARDLCSMARMDFSTAASLSRCSAPTLHGSPCFAASSCKKRGPWRNSAIPTRWRFMMSVNAMARCISSWRSAPEEQHGN